MQALCVLVFIYLCKIWKARTVCLVVVISCVLLSHLISFWSHSCCD